jgi:type IV pilus assembly protein PilY1
MNTLMKRIRTTLVAGACVIAGGAAVPVVADDTEIYFNSNASHDSQPLVMFVLDYRPNLGSTFCDSTSKGCDTLIAEGFLNPVNPSQITFLEVLRGVMKKVMDPLDNLKVGLMVSHNAENNCVGPSATGCSNGAYVVYGFRSLSEPNTHADFAESLASIPVPSGNLSHSWQGKELYLELFRYLTGQGIYNGHLGHTDFDDRNDNDNLDDVTYDGPGDVDFNRDIDGDGSLNVDANGRPLLAWDETIENGANYISPLNGVAMQCAGIFVINIVFGTTTQANDSDSAIAASLASGGMGFSPSNGDDGYEEVISFMHSHDHADSSVHPGTADIEGVQSVTSYFITDSDRRKVNSFANFGGTTQALLLGDTVQELVELLSNLFKEILKLNSTFEAPAVTVNAFNRLTNRDELFYALFRPNDNPDWPGNLKKYKLGTVTDDQGTRLEIVDATGAAAVNNVNGFFRETACSFWTNCDPSTGGGADGSAVDMGGAAERIKNQVVGPNDANTPQRHLYTFLGTLASITPPLSGSQTLSTYPVHETNTDLTDYLENRYSIANSDAQDLVKFARGIDPNDANAPQGPLVFPVDENNVGGGWNTMGDPLHSRPAVITYDAKLATPDVEPDLALAVTTNEGVFHLIDAATGNELFAFMPRILFDTLQLIRDPNTVSDPNRAMEDRYSVYGIDGSPLVWAVDANEDGDLFDAGEHVFVYLTQRRGGRNLWALDITDRSSPKLKWVIRGGVAGGDFEELGWTWSRPVLGRVKSGGSETTVLFFGGGYDPDQDDATVPQADDVGRAIYMVDATTGELLGWAGPAAASGPAGGKLVITGMENSVPAEVVSLDIDGNGLTDRLYTVDVIGRVIRIDLDNTGDDVSAEGGIMARLQESGSGPCAAESCNRRFHNAPDVSLITGTSRGAFLSLALGSGFRAHPKNKAIEDRFYALADTHIIGEVPSTDYSTEYNWTEADLLDVTNNVDATNLNTLLQTKDGWFIRLDSTNGEKSLSESLTFGNNILFTTFVPVDQAAAGNACLPSAGRGRFFLLHAFDARPVQNFHQPLSTGPLTAEDRATYVERSGIPAEPLVLLHHDDTTGETDPVVIVTTEVVDTELVITTDRTWWLPDR